MYPILPVALGQGFTQSLPEMSTGNTKKIYILFLGIKVRLVRGADNLTAIYEPIV
jgi:hypothetical protein